MSGQELDELMADRICYRCVGEDYLSKEIRRIGKRGKCSYCGNTAKSQSVEEIAKRIADVFEEHFVRTADEPTGFEYAMQADKESEYSWEREGERITEAIMDAAKIPERAARDIQQLLEGEHSCYGPDSIGEECEFSSESYYEEKGTSDVFWQGLWREYEQSMKAESRYFNQFATDFLSDVFEGIDLMRARDNRSLVIEAGPGKAISAFYRARAFQSDEELILALKRPDMHLGSPPSARATAGRMNACGISVFYGANDPKVAMAEVRPPVGSQVAVACFELVRPISLLDLTALGDVVRRGSIFDPTFTRELERAMFLRSLCRRITKPVMPDDEAFAYIATQAVADFLSSNTMVPMDGILFPSVQTGGLAQNVVLFQKASRVDAMDIPLGAEIDASLSTNTEDGPEPDYCVTERVISNPTMEGHPSYAGGATRLHGQFAFGYEDPNFDSREPTLRLIADSVRVHVIQGVDFRTEEHIVRRLRMDIDAGSDKFSF